MNVKVIKSNAFYKAEIETIKSINEDNNTYFHIVLCPDRYSLISEKLIFDTLKIRSTFNIEVLSVSKLYNKFCKTNEKILSSSASILLIQKALINLHDKLKVFNNLNNIAYLSEEIYKALSQIISCDISFTELKFKTKSNLLNDKLEDLSLIYEEYLKLLESKIDSNKQLELICEILPKLNLSKTRFYLIGYDSFTKQILKVLTGLIKYSNKVVVSCLCASEFNNNKRIYSSEVYNDILNICSNLNINLIEKEFFVKGNNYQNFLVNNLFGNYKEKTQNKNFVTINVESSIKDEVKNLIKNINYLTINKGFSFNDIQIYLPNESYEDLLKKEFNKFKMPYFFDKDYKVSNLVVIKFINLILKNLKSNFYKNDLFDLLNSAFIDIPQTKINDYKSLYIKNSYEFGLNLFNDIDAFKQLFDNLTYLQNIYKNVKFSTEFVDLIKQIIEKFNLVEKNEKLILDNYNLEFSKYNEQTFIKLENIFEIFNSFLQNVSTNIKELVLLFNNICETINVSVVPIKSSSIYVGFDNSYFENKKVLFCLGVLSSDFPKYYQDTSLISDYEIKTIENYIKLSPSVLTLNKRNLFKAFTILTSCTEKLYLSYSENNFDSNKQKSSIIDDILNIFYDENNKKLSLHTTKKDCNLAYGINKYDLLIESAKNKVLGINSNLNSILKDNIQEENFNDVNLLQDNKLSISMIEKYNSCPYMFFVDYAIKPKTISNKLMLNEMGNIVHLIAEKYLTCFDKVKDIKKFVNDIFTKIITQQFSYVSNNTSYIGIINNLKNSIIILCENLYESINNSKFKPKFLEYKFNNIKISDDISYVVNGKIDRVDTYNDNFIVIDYKTGNKVANFKDIYYGNSLQLMFYTYAIKQICNLNPVGAFYLNTKKIDKKTNSLNYNGYVLNNIDLVKNLDKLVNGKSKFYPFIIKDDNLSSKNLLNENEINNIYKYINNLIILTANNIKNKNFLPNPSGIKESCKYCKYKNFCNFNDKIYSSRKDLFKEEEIENILKREE